MTLLAVAGILLAVWVAVQFLPVRPRDPGVFRSPARPLVIAHRGGSALAPENTLAAFDRAEKLGVDAVELDIQLSKDGFLVVIHDETVDSVTESTGAVADMTLAELKRLDAAYRFRDSTGAYPLRGKGIAIPTLEEVFQAFPRLPLVVEMKTPSPEMEQKLLVLIDQYDRRRSVVVSCERDEPLRRFGALSGHAVPLGAGEDEARRFILSAKTGLDRLFSFDAAVLQIPLFASGLDLATPRVVAAAHAHNIAVQFWTINDEDEMRRLVSLGVDGITTDRPDLALAIVKGER